MSRIADFIKAIENGNENFNNLINNNFGGITIGYDVSYDSVTITDEKCPGDQVFYPEDLDIEI